VSVQLNPAQKQTLSQIKSEEENFDTYLDSQSSAIYSRDNLNNALNILKEAISTDLAISHFVHMFEFSVVDKHNWELAVCMDYPIAGEGEHFYCFNAGKHDEALEIIKNYIALDFKDEIQDITIKNSNRPESDLYRGNKHIHIVWKS
jgi:hypothetical protein